MKKFRTYIAFLLCIAIVMPLISFSTITADAAANIDSDSVFLKQQERFTCTLCSNVMMLRRAALLRGDSDWNTITEYGARPYLWVEGCGMTFSYTYRGLSVTNQTIYGNAESVLREALAKHPEGVVAYDYSYPHAILLTDYKDGVFYCADPANCTPRGRMTSDKAIISVASADSYWYVTTPLTPEQSDLKNNSKVTDCTHYTGCTVKVKGYASKGDGNYRFTYEYKKDSDSSYTKIGSSKTADAVKYFTPASAGKYIVRVTVYDGMGGKVQKKIKIDVVDPKPLKNNSTVSYEAVRSGEAVTINAAAGNGAGAYRYRYSYRFQGEKSWTLLTEKSTTDTSYKFTPDATGTWELRVRAYDKLGNYCDKVMSVRAVSDIKNCSFIVTSRPCISSPLYVIGNSSCGEGDKTYSYYYKQSGAKNWVPIAVNTVATSAQFTPCNTGTYLVKVVVTDKTGGTDDKTLSVIVK